MNKEAPIGVFDSGVGGLTVVKEIIHQLPNENVIFFGDTARVPYGSKSKGTIAMYTKQIVRFLKTKDVKAIVIACNTATAYGLDEVAKELDIPIIGVIKPGAKMAAHISQNKKVGIIGTEATINSGLYPDVLKTYDQDIQAISKACPLFVPLVEEGLTDDFVTDEIASRYLKVLKCEGVDTVVLGCTHYPLICETIQKIMGDQVQLVNPAYETAIALKRLLIKHGTLNDTNKPSSYEFFVSDRAERFKLFANSILPVRLQKAQVVPIEEY